MIDAARLQKEAFALLVGVSASLALVLVWHVTGLAPVQPPRYSYGLSQFVTLITAGFIFAYALVAFGVGWATRAPVSCAFGMMLLLPAATLIEISRDPTSHNMLPMEVTFLWIPAFALALACAFMGMVARSLTNP